MNKINKTLALLFTVLFSLGLTGCNSGGGGISGPSGTTSGGTTSGGTTSGGTTSGGTTSGGTSTGTPSVPPTTGTAKTIAISWPFTNSVENLGGGMYRRIGTAIVTDQDGNAVPDGTLVYLNVVDSILAQGTTASATVSGSTVTDAGVTMGDGTTATGFATTWVYRNDTYRLIEPGDMLLLVGAEPDDKVRAVSNVTLTATTLGADTAYVNSYPFSPNYTAGVTGYLVGASLLGAEISGQDSSGTLTTGVAATVNGIATFQITYPANPYTILTGCGNPTADTRSLPAGSARVYVTAKVDGSTVSTVNNYFCFASIAGGTLTVSPTDVSATTTVYVTPRDGGDSVPLPFQTVNVAVKNPAGGAAVTATQPVFNGPDTFGTSTITVGGTSGGTATVVYSWDSGSGVVTAEVSVTVP